MCDPDGVEDQLCIYFYKHMIPTGSRNSLLLIAKFKEYSDIIHCQCGHDCTRDDSKTDEVKPRNRR